MRPRSDSRPLTLELQAFYSIAALARVGNVTTDLLRRLLRANGVTFLHAGRTLYVPLSEIQQRIPPLWKSLCAAAEAKHAAGARTGKSPA